MSDSVPALAGAILILAFVIFVLFVIWRLCNGPASCAAQSAHVPTDDDLEMLRIAKAINAGPVMICNQDGLFTVNERGEWVPFEGGR